MAPYDFLSPQTSKQEMSFRCAGLSQIPVFCNFDGIPSKSKFVLRQTEKHGIIAFPTI
jgi:hypothetical protein